MIQQDIINGDLQSVPDDPALIRNHEIDIVKQDRGNIRTPVVAETDDPLSQQSGILVCIQAQAGDPFLLCGRDHPVREAVNSINLAPEKDQSSLTRSHFPLRFCPMHTPPPVH